MGKFKCAIQWVALGDRELAINPASGGWLLLDDTCKHIIAAIEEADSISEVIQQFPTVNSREIVHLAQLLEEHNLTTQENFSCVAFCSGCHEKRIPHHAVLNLTEACNLKCTYCYVNAGCSQTEYMKLETAVKIVEELLEMNADGKINIILHGGEPLLNWDMVQKLTAYAEEFYPDRVTFSLQTNGTLLTEEISQFLKVHDFKVGISIDGPEEFHNQTRPLQSGKGSFSQVMRGIHILQENQVPFGVLTVLNGRNWNHMDEMVDFYLANEIYTFTFLPMLKIGRGQDDQDEFVDGEKIFLAYRRLLERILEHNAVSEQSKWINERTLKYLARSIFAHMQDYMCMRAPCGAGQDTLGFGVKGDFYPCDNFTNDPAFRIGSIEEGTIREQLLASGIVEKAASRSPEKMSLCRECVWRGLCGGNCYAADYYSGGDGTFETDNCAFKKRIIPYLIQLFGERPDFPGLLDPDLKTAGQRVVLFDMRQGRTEEDIDRELFGNLLQLHDVKHGDRVLISGYDSEDVDGLSGLFAAVNKRGGDSWLVTDGTKLVDAEYCRKLIQAGPDNLRMQFDEALCQNAEDSDAGMKQFDAYLKGAENFLSMRKKESRSRTLHLVVPACRMLFNTKFAEWAEEHLRGLDRILIYESSSQQKDALQQSSEINAVLNQIRKHSLETKVQLLDIRAERLLPENRVFTVGEEEDQMVLLIDGNHLAGLELKQIPAIL